MFSRIKDAILKLSNWVEVIIAIMIMASVFILGGKLVSVESVVEIVLFSVSREIIVERLTGLETLLIIAALLLIFVIRKYLMHADTAKQDTEQQNNIVV